MSLNCNGSLESKLECVDFVNCLSCHDIIVLSECWINRNSVLNLEGYECVTKCRRRRKRAKRDSGGMCVFVKREIWSGVTEIDWDFEDGLLFLLEAKFFNFPENVYLICPYVKPSTSTRNVIDNGPDVFDLISDKLSELHVSGQMVLMGDLNARLGNAMDYTFLDADDDFLYVHDPQFERMIHVDDVMRNDLSVKRACMDKGSNTYGPKLVNLCTMSNMMILNGRLSGDSLGKYTCCMPNGQSVVDYALCTKDVLYDIIDFQVSDFNAFSDHAQICLKLKCHVIQRECDLSTKSVEFKTKWNDDKNDEYVNNLSSPENVAILDEISCTLDRVIVTEVVLDDCVSRLNEVALSAGREHRVRVGHLGHEYKGGKWYDFECAERRVLFTEAERLFIATGDPNDRAAMCAARSDYRKCCRLKRKLYKSSQAEALLDMSKHNPKQFWRKIKPKNKNKLGNCNFEEYFKDLNNIHPFMGEREEEDVKRWEMNGFTVRDVILDSDICMEELDTAIKRLKNAKASGFDGIINEFIKHASTLFKQVLLKLFNVIFNTGIFPKIWAIGEIVPIHKKGDVNDPSNYRGITLMSCLGKLFTSIVNNRLTNWAEENHVYCENQFGFRKEKGTTDCMFILHGIIELLLNKSNPFFCAFVDLKRAFDGTNRRALWYKLHNSKISSKMNSLIQNMYSKIKLCMKNVQARSGDDECFFSSVAGVYQGESLSPFLFSMFLNDLHDNLKSNDGVGVMLEDLLLTVLLFADDMIIFSLTREGLQTGLDTLDEYCSRWGLTVNINKTKCVAFRNGGKIGQLDRWTFRHEYLETVSEFRYLGFVFGSSGKFSKGIDDLKKRSLRALFGLKNILHKYPDIAPRLQIKLFNSLVMPIISSSCEIWGFENAPQLDTVYLGFLKSLLGVRKSVPTPYVYKELGVQPLKNDRIKRMVKYWVKILNLPDGSPVKKVYRLLVQNIEQHNLLPTGHVKNWASAVKNILESHGFGFVWQRQNVPNANSFLSMFNQRIDDMYLQQSHANVDECSVHRLYNHLNVPNGGANYIECIKEKYIRIAISRMRLGSHCFMVERGRWERPKREYGLRKCNVCNDIEDEYHIVMSCPRFSALRSRYLNKSLYCKPSMFKFISFLNSATGKDLKHFGIFCSKVMIKYNESII